jgi:hypothetical protein
LPAGVAIAPCTLTRCRIWSRRSRLIGLRRIRSSVSPHSFFILFYFITIASFAGIDVLFLCSLTYDATLTEPTSLKMMRAAKDDEQLHLDVSKPWQVCLSTPFHTSIDWHPAGYSLLPFPCTTASDSRNPSDKGRSSCLGCSRSQGGASLRCTAEVSLGSLGR